MSTDNVYPLPTYGRDAAMRRLVAAAEAVGEARVTARLAQLGVVHCLAPDVPEAELVRVLAAGGLCVSSVGGVQLIHRRPESAA